MFKCHVCGSSESHTEYVSEVFEIDSKFHLVENIPAIVCSRCGEEVFSSETSEAIRVMLHGESKPVKSVVLDVFTFQSANPNKKRQAGTMKGQILMPDDFDEPLEEFAEYM